jgi:hypothetical protein
MSKPRATTGAGCALNYGDGASPENFTKLAQITIIKRSGWKQATEKVTNQDSTINAANQIYQELIGTIVDPGTVEVTVNWVPNDVTHKAMLTRFDGQPHNYTITGPLDPGVSPEVPRFTIAFSATQFDFPDMNLELDKAMMLPIKLQIIGQPIITFSE